MSRRAQHKADTRAALLQAASDLFARDGFERTTTRGIAARAGVGTGTLFLHFHDKDALVAALLRAHVDAALAQGFATLPQGLVPRLVHVATALYTAYDARPDLARVLIERSLFATEGDDQLLAFQAWCTAEVEAAVARGEVRPVAPHIAFFAYFSHYFSVLVAGLRGELSPEARGATLTALLARFFQVEEVGCASTS